MWAGAKRKLTKLGCIAKKLIQNSAGPTSPGAPPSPAAAVQPAESRRRGQGRLQGRGVEREAQMIVREHRQPQLEAGQRVRGRDQLPRLPAPGGQGGAPPRHGDRGRAGPEWISPLHVEIQSVRQENKKQKNIENENPVEDLLTLSPTLKPSQNRLSLTRRKSNSKQPKISSLPTRSRTPARWSSSKCNNLNLKHTQWNKI